MGAPEGLLRVVAALGCILEIGAFYISQNLTTKVFNDDTFMVVCRDDLEGHAITWRNPKGVTLGPKSRPKVESGSYGTSIVFTNPHKVEDTGNYTCETKKEKRVFELFVEAPLKFTDTSTNQTGDEGTDFVLKCEVTGGSISWAIEGGGNIEHNKKYKVIADGLVIRNVSRHDAKTYICKGIQQRTGTVSDRRIHFNVKHKPVHPSHPQRHMRQDVVYGYINGTVNLTCLAVANPAATFRWESKNKKEKKAQVIDESPEVSILQIHIDGDDIFGNYKCIAKNKLGTYEESFALKKGTKPTLPKSVTVRETRGREVVLEILEGDKAPDTELDTKGFSVMYRKVDGDWKQAEFNISRTNLYTLRNLEPNCEYLLKTATRNAAGLSDYFPPVVWTTSRATTVQLCSLIPLTVLFNFAFW